MTSTSFTLEASQVGLVPFASFRNVSLLMLKLFNGLRWLGLDFACTFGVDFLLFDIVTDSLVYVASDLLLLRLCAGV